MANDAKLGPPQAGGPKPVVKYALIGGALILAYILYKRYAAGATTASSGTTDTTSAPPTSFAVDPSTGVPINPTTGQDFGQIASAAPSLSSWTSAAYNALLGQGADPGTSSNALYNYTNGLPLTVTQGGLIDKALGAVCMAPGDLLPFNPSDPIITPTPILGGSGQPPQAPPVVAKLPNALQTFVNDVYANIHAGTVKNPANVKLAEADVKSGKAALPTGFTAPAGYVLNPSTRILTKKAA